MKQIEEQFLNTQLILFSEQFYSKVETMFLVKVGLTQNRFSQNVNKNFQAFCPGSLLEGRAEILVIFGWHFGSLLGETMTS